MYRILALIFIFLLNSSAALAQPLMNSEAGLKLSVAGMSLEEKVGQLFMAAFREENGQPVTVVTKKVTDEIQRYHLGGVILFRENFADFEKTLKLTRDLECAGGNIPLFIAVDQEGGRINRFSFGTNLPGNMALGASGKVKNAYSAGRILGEELAALGINLDLAPVLDVSSNQDNPVIGLRSFGAEGAMVSKLGAAYIEGLHAGGVLAAVKHFPGHGDTLLDSHLDLPIVHYDKSRLQAVELRPFRENLINTDIVMAAHIAFPALDDTMILSKKDGQPVFLPATLSHKILTNLLREEFGYGGVIITDALEMKAVTEHFGPEAAAVRAIQAGADILLMPKDLAQAYSGIMDAVKTGAISEERLNESVERILRLKSRVIQGNAALKKAQKTVGGKEHREEENRLAREAVTLLKNEAKVLPLAPHSRAVLFAPWQDMLAVMQDEAEKKLGNDLHAFSYEKLGELTSEHKAALEQADFVILATYSSTLQSRTPGESALASFAKNLSDYACSNGKKIIIIAAGTPYDILYLNSAAAYLAVYGASEANIRAGMKALFGAKFEGKLPVTITSQGEVLYKIGSGLIY